MAINSHVLKKYLIEIEKYTSSLYDEQVDKLFRDIEFTVSNEQLDQLFSDIEFALNTEIGIDFKSLCLKEIISINEKDIYNEDPYLCILKGEFTLVNTDRCIFALIFTIYEGTNLFLSLKSLIDNTDMSDIKNIEDLNESTRSFYSITKGKGDEYASIIL